MRRWFHYPRTTDPNWHAAEPKTALPSLDVTSSGDPEDRVVCHSSTPRFVQNHRRRSTSSVGYGSSMQQDPRYHKSGYLLKQTCEPNQMEAPYAPVRLIGPAVKALNGGERKASIVTYSFVTWKFRKRSSSPVCESFRKTSGELRVNRKTCPEGRN